MMRNVFLSVFLVISVSLDVLNLFIHFIFLVLSQRRLEHAPIRFAMPVCTYDAWRNSRTAERIFKKFDMGQFY
jgi:hypothetical protein